MAQKGIIDRFEEGFAVIELDSGGFTDIAIDRMPPEVEEGSVIYIEEDGSVVVSIKETIERRKKVKKLMDKLFKE
ncbi:MAG: DUF3006 domain-containing protein [Clostridiales bacterium]|nr:DUF3006 domain-containing protein [Clostridiales bacterium]